MKGGMALTKFVTLEYDDCDTTYIEIAPDRRVSYHLYNANCAYDINQADMSTLIPGHLQWGEFFQLYQVISTTIVVNWSNTSAYPIYVGIVAGDFLYPELPGVTSADDWKLWFQMYPERPRGTIKRALLTPQSGSGSRLKQTMHVNHARLVGNRAYVTGDLSWQANINANPQRKTFIGLYAMTGNGNLYADEAQEIYHSVRIYQHIKYFDRQELDATLPTDFVNDTTILPNQSFTGPG